MNKEQTIQDMAQLMCDYLDFFLNNELCDGNCIKEKECNMVRRAEKLYNAGYRKADDIYKEILQEISDIPMGLDSDNEEMYARDFSWYKDLCAKHGVDFSEQIRK